MQESPRFCSRSSGCEMEDAESFPSSSATPHRRSFPLEWLQELPLPSRSALFELLLPQAPSSNQPIVRLPQVSPTKNIIQSSFRPEKIGSGTFSQSPHGESSVHQHSKPSQDQRISVPFAVVTKNHCERDSTMVDRPFVHSTRNLLRYHVMKTKCVQRRALPSILCCT